jgi:hypothetical protein
VPREHLRGMRICLVHANPWQAVRPVPPYGLHRLRTALEACGAQVDIVDPYLQWPADRVPSALAERIADLAPDLVGFSLRVLDSLLPVESVDGDDYGSDSTPLLEGIHTIVQLARAAAPSVPFVLGGAAFPTAPHELLDELDVDLGILGNGEAALVDLAARLRTGRSLDGVDGLVRRGVRVPVRPAAAVLATTTRRDPLFAPVFSVPVRTRSGCGMFCSYCTSANTGGVNSTYTLDVVLDELGEVAEKARDLGIVAEVHFADEEFNLPTEDHAVAVLSGMVERGYTDALRWGAYLNPRPFSDRLAELTKATNGVPEFTVDSASDTVLRVNRKPFRRKHLDQLIEVLVGHDLHATLYLMFGLPGETWDTVAETIEWARQLPATLTVAWAMGVRVLPGLPVASVAVAEPQHVYGGTGPSFTEPSIYCPLGPPRRVARQINQMLVELPHMPPMPAGPSMWEGTGCLAVAYRLVAAGADVDTWVHEVVKDAEGRGELRGRLLQSVRLIALWNGRDDLAAATPDPRAPGAVAGVLPGLPRALPRAPRSGWSVRHWPAGADLARNVLRRQRVR